MAYAEKTKVPVSQTKAEIEKLVTKYGATQFISGWTEDKVAVGFTIDGRQVRIELPLPLDDEQDVKRRWRSLAAVLKAKLVAVEDGISTIEREFLADVVLADGSTVGAWASEQIAMVYDTGQMPALLPGPLALTSGGD